jgi:hypothetical protein
MLKLLVLYLDTISKLNLLRFVFLKSGNRKPLTSSWKPLVFSHTQILIPSYIFYYYFILRYTSFCFTSLMLSSHHTIEFYFIFQIIFHLLVQNWINRPVEPRIRTNQSRKNQTFKKDRIEPHYCNHGLEWVVCLDPKSPYPTHCPPIIVRDLWRLEKLLERYDVIINNLF